MKRFIQSICSGYLTARATDTGVLYKNNMPVGEYEFAGCVFTITTAIGVITSPLASMVIMKNTNEEKFFMTKATLDLDQELIEAICLHEIGHVVLQGDIIREKLTNLSSDEMVMLDDLCMEIEADEYALSKGANILDALQAIHDSLPKWTLYAKSLIRKRIKHLRRIP